VELSEDDPVEVVRVTEFRTVDGAFVGNVSTSPNCQQNSNKKDRYTMNKKKLVDALIQNHGWEETDREYLMGLNEDKLSKITPKDEEEDMEDEETTPPAKKKPTVPVANSVEEFIGQAPAEMQDVLRSGLAAHQAQKISLIDVIVGNSSNKFTKEQLTAMPMGQLEAIAALAKAPVQNEQQQRQPNYAGQGGQGSAPVTNSKQEPLQAPTIDWKKQ
jgi:hypothetical protein